MLKIPPATKVVGTATYDNTAGNPHNPNTPLKPFVLVSTQQMKCL